MWVLLGAHDSEEPDANDHDRRSRYRESRFSKSIADVALRRQLKRQYVLTFFQKLPPCLVGIEACASSHHWSRQLQALGHTVRLMPPAYVKPYVMWPHPLIERPAA
jgi:transposase